MPKLTTIVAGVDFSRMSHRAVIWAGRHLAPDAEFVLVHALELPVPPSFLGVTTDQHVIAEEIRAASQDDLTALAAEIGAERVRAEVPLGSASGALSEVAERTGADLVLVGPHGERGGMAGLLGSTAERVLALSTVPVLLAAGDLGEAPRKVLVAIDDSDRRHRVLAWARFLAERFHASVQAFHCLDSRLFGRMRLISSSDRVEDLTRAAAQDAAAWVRRQLTEAGLPAADENVLVTVDSPGQAIDRLSANGHDLLIIGSRREGTTHRLFLGSMAKRVIRRTEVPVLMVPGP